MEIETLTDKKLPQLKLFIPMIIIAVLFFIYIVIICYVRTNKYHKLSDIRGKQVEDFMKKNSL